VPVIVADTKIDKYYFNDSLVKFFKAGDEADLARCILTMINDRRARESRIKNSLQYIQTMNWSTRKQEYFDLVDNLVNNNGKTAH
jgi:glycosyltransferase involved in cell wall biosynthesis